MKKNATCLTKGRFLSKPREMARKGSKLQKPEIIEGRRGEFLTHFLKDRKPSRKLGEEGEKRVKG